MRYADHLRDMFPELDLAPSDILLLEPHQISGLAGRVDPRTLADAIAVEPMIADHLVSRCPPLAGYLERLPSGSASRGVAAAQDFLWEIGDWFVYVKDPASYDAHPIHAWDFSVVTDRVALDGATVVDAGAGTGKVTFEAALLAAIVYALEPTKVLRSFIDDKAAAAGIGNVRTLDGTLDAIPLPAATADVLLTCRAIGWNLDQELDEIGRIVKPGGAALHLGMPDPPGENQPLHDGLVACGYDVVSYTHAAMPALLYLYEF